MIAFVTRHLSNIFLAAIIIFALFLRVLNLSQPSLIELDEKGWIINGVSILETGRPRSWTMFWETYPAADFYPIGGGYEAVVEPFLDHPPLFSVLIGAWTKVVGIKESFNWQLVRLPMLAIAGVTIFLTALLAARIFDQRDRLLAGLSLAILPTHILASRYVAAESAIALLLIASLLLTGNYLENKRKNWSLLGLLILGFMAPLLKLTGIAVPLCAMLIFFSRRQYRPTMVIAGGLLLSLAVIIGYGYLFDGTLFWQIMAQHSQRPQTFWNFFSLFNQIDLGNFSVPDPLFILGLIGSFAVAVKQIKNQVFLTVPLIIITGLLLAVAPVEMYGWYKYLIFPWVALGLTYVWREFFNGKFAWSILLTPSVLVLMQNVFDLGSLARKFLLLLAFVPLAWFATRSESIESSFWYRVWTLTLFLMASSLQVIWAVQLLLGI